eukprot:CAMPEP_0113533452 /NCGR_PEP_ID=MMETSP0015_2-20120614/4614_1 /TAXON_ID=2838 /ORGANISM="Odontella" /LENGTH=781 /DNA_ID=CAMNT_0000432509 /DNA_START=155 /DNA_END=2500 /DNA_ORIENTATION=- /assembly_acc=CAM_ASM_000160
MARHTYVLVAFAGFWSVLPVAAAATSVTEDAFSGVTEPIEDYRVPSFALSDLLGRRRRSELAAALASTGLIAVTGMGSSVDGAGQLEVESSRSTALSGLCRCVSDNAASLLAVEGADRAILKDFSRTSIATATSGKTPLPLPAKGIDAACGTHGLSGAMEDIRDLTAEASRAFVTALDGLFGEAFLTSLEANDPVEKGDEQQLILMQSIIDNGFEQKYSSLKSIVGGARHLEHFHVYSKGEEHSEPVHNGVEDGNTVLDLHTDAGLFLSFIPALSCESNKRQNDESFLISVPASDGTTRLSKLKRAIFPTDSVAIMLGIGAEKWLNTPRDVYGNSGVALKATRHAVRMNSGEARAWYGMMHLVPDNAIVQKSPSPKTFADMRKSMASSSKRADQRRFGDLDEKDARSEDVAIGCGIIQSSSISSYPDSFSSPIQEQRGRRRRLQMVGDASECNNRTNFYCWMSCLEIPDAPNAAARIEEGQALYCLEPSTLAASGDRVDVAVKQCNIAGVSGAAMNEACIGSWQEKVPSVPNQKVYFDQSVDEISNETHHKFENMHTGDEPYCYGATSMYMRGFQWAGTTCVVYLFPSWVLSTAGKFAGACIGTIVLSASLEGVIHSRRRVLADISPGWTRLAASAGLYGLQLTTGYLVMLLVMTYSGPLFICVILGLMLGHSFFNYQSLVSSKKDAPIPEGCTPCCQNDLGLNKHDQQEKSSGRTGNATDHSGATEGAEKTLSGTCCGNSTENDDACEVAKKEPVTSSCCSGGMDKFLDECDIEASISSK